MTEQRPRVSGQTGVAGATAPGFPAWDRALVYGLGRSGRSAARLLLARGVRVLGVDRRLRDELDLGGWADDPLFELEAERQLTAVPPGIDGVVASPGVPWDLPFFEQARRRGVKVVSEVELASWVAPGPIIGITGSNGKSTTTALTGALLEDAGFAVEVCGNIGVPLSARVEGPPGRIFVVELSSFQLEGIDTFRPSAAAILNVSPDHLDRHADLDAYLEAKCAIVRNQGKADVVVLNADDPLVAAVGARARRRFFSRLRQVEDGCYLDGDTVFETAPGDPPTPLFARHELAIPGLHNLENAMAAALLARAAGARAKRFGAVMASFAGLRHRMETVGERRGVTWINDSKATNVAAAIKSLGSFESSSVHLILGGRSKGADLAPLAEHAAKIRRLYLIGEAAAELEAVFSDLVALESCGDLERAVERAAQMAEVGETVLLSPACASFDQYDSFEQRGDHFRRLVEELGDRRGGEDG